MKNCLPNKAVAKTYWLQFLKKHAVPIFLIGGFIFDNFTLRRSDRLFENLVLLGYVVISAGFIFWLNTAKNPSDRLKFWLVGAIQFCFGNLFSAFLIFYSRSGAVSASWPFLFLLVGLMIGNEVFKKRYQQLAFQVGTWFFAAFSFLIFFLPVILKSLSVWVFLLSGVVSLVAAGILVNGLMFFIKSQVEQSRRAIRIGVVGIYLAINILYFTNLIPPIPLAMKEGGIYHSVERSGNNYRVLAEKESWLDRLWPGQTFHVPAGQPLYLFSAIFSPSDLDTDIIHEWWHYNEGVGEWQLASRVAVPVVGGREGGYRLYSYLIPGVGQWRVDVETPRGQIIGRVKFEVENVAKAPDLVVEEK